MSGSDACSVCSHCVFLLFSMPCNFFMRGGRDVQGKINCSKQAFGNVMVKCVGKENVL